MFLKIQQLLKSAEKIYARVVGGVAAGRRSGGQLATTLVDTISVIIFFFPAPPTHF